MSNLPPLALVIVLALAAVGIGLFIFNMCQAASGLKTMGEIKRKHEEHNDAMDQITTLQIRLDELKTQFFACSLPLAEKQQMWKPVDAALALAVPALLDGDSETATRHLHRAVSEAGTLAADFAIETE